MSHVQILTAPELSALITRMETRFQRMLKDNAPMSELYKLNDQIGFVIDVYNSKKLTTN